MYDGALRFVNNRINVVEKKVEALTGDQPVVNLSKQSDPQFSREEIERLIECSIEKYIETYSEEQYNNLKKGLGNIVSMKIEQHLESKLKDIYNNIDNLKATLQDIISNNSEQPNSSLAPAPAPAPKSKKGKSSNSNKKTLDITEDT